MRLGRLSSRRRARFEPGSREWEKHLHFREAKGFIKDGHWLQHAALDAATLPPMPKRQEDLLHILYLCLEKEGAAVVQLLHTRRSPSCALLFVLLRAATRERRPGLGFGSVRPATPIEEWIIPHESQKAGNVPAQGEQRECWVLVSEHAACALRPGFALCSRTCKSPCICTRSVLWWNRARRFASCWEKLRWNGFFTFFFELLQIQPEAIFVFFARVK